MDSKYLETAEIFFCRGLVAVGEVATVGEVEGENSVVGFEDGGVDLEVRGGAGEALHVNSPLLRIQIKRLQSSLLAQTLHLINILIPTVITSAGVAFGVLVGHD